MTYRPTSPYADTPQTSWYTGRYVHRSVPPAADDEPFTITPEYEHRPDLLSDHFYGTWELWWVFYARNIGVLKSPVWGMTTGKTIMVPSPQRIQSMFGSSGGF